MTKNHLLSSAFSVLFFFVLSSCQQNEKTNPLPEYGISFKNNQIYTRVWSPDAEGVRINIYRDCNSKTAVLTRNLNKAEDGDWVLDLPDSLIGYSYTFSVSRNSGESKEVVDPFVKATCANGNRAAFINPAEVNPDLWEQDEFFNRAEFDPVVIYELHVRDFSMDPNSGMQNKGKYLAFTEKNTSGDSGQKTGLDYISGLGVTHLHLLPVFDFASIDETSETPNYNWGYDPQNYFVPEGSYSSEPNNPEARIREFKAMVKSIHERKMAVVMDVVYNHTYYLDNSSFQEWAPGYYYRQNDDGTYSNASACGNEIATEKEMVRLIILESLKYWMKEYHVDGFRFDLMGIMDIPTMNLISEELKKINPGVLLYGEGWLAGSSPLPDSLRATKANMSKIPGIAAFSDEIRDGIKGHWSDEMDKGFVSGKKGMKPSVKFGIAGGCSHPQINYSQVNNSSFPWADKPWQCINYVSCHDNHTLIDKLEISAPEYDFEARKKMHLLAQTIVLCGMGTPFLHAGTEFYRTKFGDHNSFESPDSINMIRWSQAYENREAVDYMRDLITFRKENPAFWPKSAEEMRSRLEFLDGENSEILYYSIISEDNTGDFQKALFIFAGTDIEETVSLPDGIWNVRFSSFKSIDGETKSGKLRVKGPQALILTR